MNTVNEDRPPHGSGQVGLFDEDGLPWTSRIRWGLLLFWIAAVLLVLAPLVGIYLSLWLISKGKSVLPLVLYLVLVVISVAAFFVPFPLHGTASSVEIVLQLTSLMLWLVAAFTLRRDIIRYYSLREGIPFALNPVLTALFGPWYVSGHLRADFPLDDSGNVGKGNMKLIS